MSNSAVWPHYCVPCMGDLPHKYCDDATRHKKTDDPCKLRLIRQEWVRFMAEENIDDEEKQVGANEG